MENLVWESIAHIASLVPMCLAGSPLPPCSASGGLAVVSVFWISVLPLSGRLIYEDVFALKLERHKLDQLDMALCLDTERNRRALHSRKVISMSLVEHMDFFLSPSKK